MGVCCAGPALLGTGEDGNNLDPGSLGLSHELTRRLIAFAESYDRVIDWDDPANTSWPDADFRAFVAEFWAVAERLQAELGEAVVVEPVPPWRE